MLGREANQNYRQGLRQGMGAFTLGSRQQAHRMRSAAVAPNVQALNATRQLNSYGMPQLQAPPLDPTMQPFAQMPQMNQMTRYRRPSFGANPLAQWLMAQR